MGWELRTDDCCDAAECEWWAKVRAPLCCDVPTDVPISDWESGMEHAVEITSLPQQTRQ